MIVLVLYCFIILSFIIGLQRLPKTSLQKNIPAQKFSIVIPFRNEEKSLHALLKSIHRLDYPTESFEVILINDESSDASLSIINPWKTKIPNLSVLNNQRFSNSPKKDALAVGIQAALHDWIVTTDADCILPNTWLHAYNSTIYQQESLFITGPISLISKSNWVQQYQKLETISLLGSTVGAFGLKHPMLCNAANMGFHKKTYLAHKNTQNNHLASGDDIFTLEYFTKNFPSQTHYLNTVAAMVQTKSEENWKTVLQQRIRWAAKSTHYKNRLTQGIGLIVLILQLRIAIGLVFYPFSSAILWLLKAGIDFILILFTAHQFQQKFSFGYYVLSAICYPFLNTYIGIKSLFGGYQWKSRAFKR